MSQPGKFDIQPKIDHGNPSLLSSRMTLLCRRVPGLDQGAVFNLALVQRTVIHPDKAILIPTDFSATYSPDRPDVLQQKQGHDQGFP